MNFWIGIVSRSLLQVIHETNQSYAAKIEAIGANIDPVSQTIDLRAKFIMKHDELLPGMSGTVTFEW